MILIWNLNKENDVYTIVGEIHLFLGANVLIETPFIGIYILNMPFYAFDMQRFI